MVRTPPSQSPELRLLTITEAIEDWIARLGPSVVSIERVFAQDNLRSVIGVAQVMGTAMATAARAGLEVAQHTPSEAKAAVTGSGTADKAQVQAMVTRILGLDAPPRPADACPLQSVAKTATMNPGTWHGHSAYRNPTPKAMTGTGQIANTGRRPCQRQNATTWTRRRHPFRETDRHGNPEQHDQTTVAAPGCGIPRCQRPAA